MTLKEHLRKNLFLAYPVVIAQVGHIMVSVADSMMNVSRRVMYDTLGSRPPIMKRYAINVSIAFVEGESDSSVVTTLGAESEQALLVNSEEGRFRLITAEIDGQFEFTTAYCPNGKSVSHDDYPNKLRWYDSLLAHWQDGSHPARVLCGDFNIVHRPLDSWREQAGDGAIFHDNAVTIRPR